MDNDLLKLIDAICEVYDIKDLEPHGETTYCNVGVHLIAKRMGFEGFSGLLANQMIALMEQSEKWIKIEMKDAQFEANKGNLIIACKYGKPSDHVAVIRPSLTLVHSNKWNADVPKCMNIGKTNFIGKVGKYTAGINWAFSEIPDFFKLEL